MAQDSKAPTARPQELSDSEIEQAAGGTGAQSTGAGAGKVTFNPFPITRKVDKASP